MKTAMLSMLACAVLLTGCGENQDRKVAALEGEVESLQSDLDTEKLRYDSELDRSADLDAKLVEAKSALDDLRLKLAATDKLKPENEQLKLRIKSLEAEIEALKASEPEPGTEPPTPTVETPETPEPELPPQPDPAVKQRLAELLPLVKTGADRAALREAMDTINDSDKQTRDDFISEMQAWVKDEPQNKHARVALAYALGSRFQDLQDNPMKQGALAGQLKTEIEKAIEIDPDYYEAVHFLAIMKVNYPTFTSEFKDANTSLDRALEMQASMTWEDRFSDIYLHYAEWFFKQDMLDEAAAKVQAGLDHAPRNQGLLDEQRKIDDAQSGAEGD